MAGYILALQIATVLSSAVMAGMMGWRKSRDNLVLLLSFILVVFGVAFGAEALWSRLDWSSSLVYTLAHILILLFLTIFPNGRFSPRWAIILQIFWTGWLAVGFFFPVISFFSLPSNLNIATQVIVYGLGMISQFYRYNRVSTPLQKQQTKWVLLGIALIFLGFLARRFSLIITGDFFQRHDALHLLYDVCFYHPVFSLPRMLVSVFLGIAILRYRLFDIDTLINRSLVYGALTASVVALYLASVSLLQIVFRAATGQASELAIVFSTALIAVIFQPLRNYLQNVIDRRFYREKINFRQVFQVFTREVRHYIDLPELLYVIVYRLTGLFHSACGAIYLYHADAGAFQLAEARNLPNNADDLGINPGQLERLRAGAIIPYETQPFAILVPLIALWADRRELVGVLALGPKLSEITYGREDLSQLSTFVDEAGTAISLAQTIAEKRKAERERETAEQATRAMAANNEAVLNNIADGVLVLDLQGNLLSANPALLRMIPEEDLPEIISEPLGKTIQWKRKVFSVTAAPVPDVGTVAVFRDETRRREMERAKDAMLATASHELRTPLTAVMNYIELMIVLTGMGRVNTTEFGEHLERALENSRRLQRLVVAILDQAQIQAGGLILKNQRINLASLFEKADQLLHSLVEQKGLSYELTIHPDVPEVIVGDPDRLHQVLVNLIGNAIKFTERGGVKVTVSTDRAERLSIAVADTGPGIPSERLPDIFEAFRRGSDYAQREHQGAGLGLSIVKEIVTRMGGNVSVSSEPGVGSIFTISIPMNDAN
jgi:signal transduction histidine kinase